MNKKTSYTGKIPQVLDETALNGDESSIGFFPTVNKKTRKSK